MLGKPLGLHIIRFPSGRYGFVGRVPTDLATAIPANKSAVMGGRAWLDESGAAMEWKVPSFETETAAREFAESKGYTPAMAPA